MAVDHPLDEAQIRVVLAAVTSFLDGPRNSTAARQQLLARAPPTHIIAALSSPDVRASQVQPMVDALRALILTRADGQDQPAGTISNSVLVAAMAHDATSVRRLALDVVAAGSVAPTPALASAILDCMDDSETEVGQAAQSTILSIGFDTLVDLIPATLVLKDLSEGNGRQGNTSSMRVIELYVRASQMGSKYAAEQLASVISRGLVGLKDDLLAKVSFFEALAPLADVPGGMRVMADHGVTEAMAQELKSASSLDTININATLSAGAILRVLARICASPETVQQLDALTPVMAPLQTILQGGSQDLALQESAIAVVGALGGSQPGWQFLQLQGGIDIFMGIFQSGRMAPALRGVCLDTLGRLVLGTPSEIEGKILMGRTNENGQHATMLWLMKLAREPFEDIRMSCLMVFSSLANQEWGPEILATVPGFVDYICDAQEPDKQLRAKKVDIAANLGSYGSKGRELFGDVRFGRLLQCGHSRSTASQRRPDPQVELATMRR